MAHDDNSDPPSDRGLRALPLSDAELRALQGDDPLLSHASVITIGRHIEGVTARDRGWTGASFANSELVHVTFAGCRFERVHFEATSFESVVFERCAFIGCSFDGARLHDVRFDDGAVRDTRWDRVEMTACSMRSVQLTGNTFEHGRVELTLRAGVMQDCRFSHCVLSSLVVSEAQVSRLRLSLCDARNVALQLCEVERLIVLGGAYDDFVIFRGTARDVSWAEVRCSKLALIEVSRIATLELNECVFGEWVVQGCAQLRDLYVFSSELAKIKIRGGALAGWITRCRVGRGSSIEECILDGWFWDESRCEGLSVRNVEFSRALGARGAEFIDMQLLEVRYGAGLDMVLDGARFESSERFGEPA